MNQPYTWPDNIKLSCIKLAKEGRSADQIAEFIHKTRNAVIGFCHRQKITIHSTRKPRTKKPLVFVKIRVSTIITPPVTHSITPITSFDHCQWLHGEARARNFCKCKATHGAWCEDHRRKVYEVKR